MKFRISDLYNKKIGKKSSPETGKAVSGGADKDGQAGNGFLTDGQSFFREAADDVDAEYSRGGAGGPAGNAASRGTDDEDFPEVDLSAVDFSDEDFSVVYSEDFENPENTGSGTGSVTAASPEREGGAAAGDSEPVKKRPCSLRAMLTGYAVWAAVILIVCLLLELFLFNNGHWRTPRGGELTERSTVSGENRENPEDGQGSSDGFTISLGDGLEQTEYGTFLITDADKASLTLNNINAEIKNLYFNAVNPAAPDVHYSIKFTDSANADLRSLHDRAVITGVPESRYVLLHLNGTTRRLKISFEANEGEELHIAKIRLNVGVPLFFHIERVIFLWLIGMLLVIFGPRSWIYITRLDLGEGRQRFLVIAVLLINIVATASAAKAAEPSVWRELRDVRDYQEREYELYAEALLKGHTWLDIRPPRYLTRMRNPYDRFQRDDLAAQYDEKVLWDAAYYNGRYYVYFGIVPALISFVPYRLVTGRALPTWKAVRGMAVLFWLLTFYFVYVLVRKYFRKTSLGIYLLLSGTFALASGVIYLVTFPVVYSVPFIYGLVFTIAGLTLWLRSFDRNGTAHRWRMAAGSLLIALTLGCRPTMILTAALAFPIFWEQIRERKFFVPKKDSLLNTGAVILPFIPVGLMQMHLNSSRFGSPFDFGADYNLTVTDLTKKTFSIAKNIPALFQELFQPLHIEPRFPFITGIEVSTGYQGYMFIDKMIGGFFALNMLALFCFWIFRIRKKMSAQKVFGLAAFSFGLAVLLIELDVQIGGISQRYMIDYGWLLMLSAILALLTILDTTDRHGYYAYLKVILVLTVLCIGVNYLSVFSDGQAISVRNYNPVLFYKIQYLLMPM